MSVVTPLRWGILATGNICNDFAHCLQFVERTDESCKITAVGASSASKAADFAERFKIAASYGTYDEALRDPNVDIFYIGTIHPSHKRLTIDALRQKKHVVCEKPLGMNVAEVEEMYRVAKEENRFLLEGVWTRFMPVVKRVRKMCSEVLGDVRYLQADFGLEFPREVERIWNKKLGGGALLDIGIYPVATVPWIFGPGEPQSLVCTGALDEASGVDVWGSIVLKYGSNRSAVVSWSGVCQTPEEVVVGGTNGYIKICGPAHVPTKASVHIKDGRAFREELIEEPLLVIEGSEFCYPGSENFVHEIRAVHEAIASGAVECADYTWEESIRVCKIMDAARNTLGLKYEQDI
jgi:dihydrodiol dehydrogenase / D-xylose 1-dehydrogenase (NADP)